MSDCVKCGAGDHCHTVERELGSSIITRKCRICGKNSHAMVMSRPVPKRLKSTQVDGDDGCMSCGGIVIGRQLYCNACKKERVREQNRMATKIFRERIKNV